MARKTAQAFRTITEVSNWLDTPTHVLRFWESKFKEIKPVKRAGGRRYYRPEDLAVIGGIKVLLHDQGHTIAAVKEMLKVQGPKVVEASAPPIVFESKRDAKNDDSAVNLPPNAPESPSPAHQDKTHHTPQPPVLGAETMHHSSDGTRIAKIRALYHELAAIRDQMAREL